MQSQQLTPPKPIVLLILDGWGIGPKNPGNAISLANTPNMDRYSIAFPHTQLAASGEAVGLPKGEDGNTETGHLNIGAGRIVYQDLPRINMSIAEGMFASNKALLQAIDHCNSSNSNFHIMGLLGSGGVHSSLNHLYAILASLKSHGFQRPVYLHLFTDGRDSPPTSGIDFINNVIQHSKEIGIGEVATVMGRYYAMDRDRRWERTQVAYEALTMGAPTCTQNMEASIKASYDAGESDEFIKPISLCGKDEKVKVIQDNDSVFFFNFRIDRPRQLAKAFVQPNFEEGIETGSFDPYQVKYTKSHLTTPVVSQKPFVRKKVLKNLCFVTMTEYERNLQTVVAFPPQLIRSPLGEIIAERGLRQLRVSETEKERFVTYYFNGQREDPFPEEDRLIIPSQKVATYDLKPEMSVREITKALLEKISTGMYDVIIVNFANADMVAHTGNLEATKKACEVTDECVGKIVETVKLLDGVVLITADHGNAEELINNDTGEVDTEHSIYPVPFIVIGKRFLNNPIQMPKGILADIAPTILKLLNISKPDNMTGRSLL